MIALKNTPKPEFLDSNRISQILNKARADIAAGDKLDLPPLWQNEEVRNALHEKHHNGKCCYCERKRDSKLERDVEHYRPKLKVSEDPNHNGYWWLAYEWDNLLISCKTCNTIYKKNHFPLRDESKRVCEEGDINGEDPLLINPAIEDPEPYFTYTTEELGGKYFTKLETTGRGVERGQATIDILQLNRGDLPKEEERSESYEHISYWIDEYTRLKRNLDETRDNGGGEMIERLERDYSVQTEKIKDHLRKEIRPEKTYSGFRRCLVRNSGQDELVELLDEA